MKKRQYFVTTYDLEKEAFTPQKGVRKGPYSLFGLRRALRSLREMGYMACKGDPSVLVECPQAVREMIEAMIARED